jgi:hypothetical protein
MLTRPYPAVWRKSSTSFGGASTLATAAAADFDLLFFTESGFWVALPDFSPKAEHFHEMGQIIWQMIDLDKLKASLLFVIIWSLFQDIPKLNSFVEVQQLLFTNFTWKLHNQNSTPPVTRTKI